MNMYSAAVHKSSTDDPAINMQHSAVGSIEKARKRALLMTIVIGMNPSSDG